MARKKTGKASKASRISKAKEKLGRDEVTDAEALAEERRKKKTAAQKREHRQVVKALEKELEHTSARQEFLDRLQEAPDPRPYKIRRKRGQGKSKPAAAYVMMASDWHMGERVRPENVGHRNEYNPGIAQERAEQFWKSQAKMLDAARAAWDVRQGVLWLGGDLMTGYIHEEYQEENFMSPVQEAFLVYKTMVSGIKYLLEKTDLEHILIPTSNGNHGRTGQRIRIATYAKNSFEWLLYQFLENSFEKEPRVKFQIASGYHNVVDLYGFRISFHHGDAIGYAGGIGGLSIPVNRRIGRQAQSVPIRWEGTEQGAPHLNVFGHFHTLQYPKFFVGNGSLIGWNDFAERIGAPFEDPLQCSFVVDERYHLVSNWNPIIVTKPKR